MSLNKSPDNPMVKKISEMLEITGPLLPLCLLSLALLTIVYHDRALFTKPHRKGLYVPPAYPLVGNTIHLVRDGVEGQLERGLDYARKSPIGCFRQTVLGVGSMLILSRPEYLEWIQKTNFTNYDKGWLFRSRFADLLGLNGIFVADGKVWSHTRKVTSNIFSAFQFRTWIEHVLHGELINVVSILDKTAARKDNQILLPELFFRFTLSSFSKMAFTTDVKCLTGDPNCLTEPVEFAHAFDFVQDVINKRFANPAWGITERFTKEGKQMRVAVKQIRDFARNIVKERVGERIALNKGDKAALEKKEKKELEKEGKDLLDLYMDHTLDHEDLATALLNALIAGRDTTAQTLSWFFYEMHMHPQHKEFILKEVESVLGSGSDRRLAYEEVKQLPYLNACISESIRLHPPVPRNGKEAVKDDIIIPQGPNPDNLPPIQVYKGELVGWYDWAMARLPEVWGEDAEEYNPSRFLSKNEDGEWQYTTPSQWIFHVFNAGPRICLGMNLALYEAMSLCATVMPKYDFKWTENQAATIPLGYQSSVTLPCTPYCVDVTVRDH